MLTRITALKNELDTFRPFGPKLLPHIRDYYRVGLTYTSNAIEGFSYTESETKVLLEEGLTVGGRPLRDALAVIGHAKAYDYMFSLLQCESLAVENMLTMHSLLEGSLENDSEAGTYRTEQVFVTGSTFAFPRADTVPAKMEELDAWIAEERDKLHPVEFAVRLHLKLVTIHPFADGNGRVARLAMNAALIQKGYMLIIVPPILRSEYIASIREAQVTENDTGKDTAYFKLMCLLYQGEIETQREMLRMLRGTE